VRALGIDLGSRRIGVAVSDTDGALAMPVEVVARGGDEAGDHRRLLALAAEFEVECLVVGLPLSLDGTMGPTATAMLAEIERLRRRTSLPVETYDERFTTVTANQRLMEQGLDATQRRQVVDKVAAAVLLQAWLDGRRLHPDARPDPDT
jgi:putative Holliday junction resolvase